MQKIKVLLYSMVMMLCIFLINGEMCFGADSGGDGFTSRTAKASFGDIPNERYFLFSYHNDQSCLVTMEDGTYMRVHEKFVDKRIIVEYYNKNYELTGTRDIKYELDKYCGFYTDGKNNYMIFARNNTEKDNKKVVCLVVKYSKNWKILGKCAIKNTNVTKFMYFTGTSMITDGGKLYVRSAREMYNGHQANITYIIRISDMKLLEKYDQVKHNKYGYVSHSFAQFMAKDGHNIITADHGDGYPRGVVINDSDLDKKKLVLQCVGEIGENYTGLCLGGLAVSGQAYITVGSSMDQNVNVNDIKDEIFSVYCTKSVQNVFISVWDKNTDKTKTTYLTHYTDNDELHAPYIVEINRNRFVVMWEHDGNVYYVEIDGAGKIVTPVQHVSARMNAKPVINNGKIVWISYDNDGNITFYSLPVSGLKCKLATPGGVKFDMESNGIKLKWNSVAGADGYYVYRKQGNSSYKKIAVVEDGSEPVYLDKNVKDGKVYTYTIEAYRKQGNTITSENKKSGWSYRFLAPVKVKTVSNKKSTIRVTWSNMKSEQGYYLYRKDNEGKIKKIAALKANKTSYEDKNVYADGKYTYYVEQYRGKNVKSAGNVKKSVYRVEQPEIYKTSVADGSIRLEIYGSKDRDTYLYRSVDGGKYKKIATLKNNKNIYNDKNVSEGKKYKYRTIVKYKGSSSYPSNSITKTYLKKVSITQIYNDKKYVRLSWTQNKNAAKYYIFRKDANYGSYSKIAIVSGSKNTVYTDKKINHLSTSTYIVKAADSYSVSSASTGNTIEHLDEPVINNVSVGDGKINVNITITNKCDVDLYRKNGAGEFVKVKHFTGNYSYSYEDTDVVSGKTYTYTARAVDGKYESSMNKGVDVAYVCAVSGLKAVQNDDKVNLSWDKVDGAVNYKIYNVDKNQLKNEFIMQTEDTQAEIILESNKDYTFGLVVEGKDSTSKMIVNENVFYYLEKPNILSVVQEKNKVRITTDISTYYDDITLYRSTSDGYEIVAVAMNPEGVFEDTIPENGLWFSYKIIVTDIHGNKKEVVSDTKVSYVGTVMIDSVKYDTDSDTVKTSWNKAEEGAAGYIVYKSTNGGEYTQVKMIDNIQTTTFEDKEITEDNTYGYKVSVYGSSEGQMSDEVKIFIPKAPDGINVVIEEGNYNISWNPVENCHEYNLHIIYPNGTTSEINVTSTSYVISASHGITRFYVTSCVNGVESKATGEKIRAGYVNDSSKISFNFIDGGFKIKYDEIQGVDGYALFRHDGEREKCVAYIEDNAVLEYDDLELTSGTTYEYRLCGYIDDGDKRYLSNGIKLRKIIYVARPSITKLTTGRGKVNITWSPVEGAVKYTLCRREKGKFWTAYKGGITGNTYTDTAVTVGTEYEYGVIALCNDSMYSSYFDWDKSKGDKITAE